MCVAPLLAQPTAQGNQGTKYIGGWVGLSPDSRVGDFTLPHRQLALLGVRAEWVIERIGHFSVAATSDIVPLAMLTHTPTYTTRTIVFPSGGTAQLKEETGNKPVYGTGAMPFGFNLRASTMPRVRLFAATSVGGLWFTRDVPLPDARRFNFAFEYGGGVEFVGNNDRAVVIGYKFHHLSNANSAAINPGLDSDVIYVGMTRRR
jgi:opacity protein-like surface antigen